MGCWLGTCPAAVRVTGLSGLTDPCHGQVLIKDLHCFYPGDLQPFTRKPLFVIVDSDNSVVFQNVPNYFGQTVVILMSPQYVPGHFQGEGRIWCRLLLWHQQQVQINNMCSVWI